MKQKQRVLESPTDSNSEDMSEGARSQLSEFEGEAEQPRRTPRREWRVPPCKSNEFRVELPKFEGQLDPDELLEWLHTVERVFKYKEVSDDKVKLVALKL